MSDLEGILVERKDDTLGDGATDVRLSRDGFKRCHDTHTHTYDFIGSCPVLDCAWNHQHDVVVAVTNLKRRQTGQDPSVRQQLIWLSWPPASLDLSHQAPQNSRGPECPPRLTARLLQLRLMILNRTLLRLLGLDAFTCATHLAGCQTLKSAEPFCLPSASGNSSTVDFRPGVASVPIDAKQRAFLKEAISGLCENIGEGARATFSAMPDGCWKQAGQSTAFKHTFCQVQP